MASNFIQTLKRYFMPNHIDAVLATIESLLIQSIPSAVKAAQLNERVYCLRIWYNGTDSDESAVPWLMLVKESTRNSFLQKHGDEAPHYIWSADEPTYKGQSFNVYISNASLQQQYAKWYAHLCELEDDEELQPFREMTQRVALKLNALDWKAIAPVTDDFIVFPADGSHTFCDDIGDMTASVPEERIAVLRSHNLLPTAE